MKLASSKHFAQFAVAAVLASYLSMVPTENAAVANGGIVYNDGVCDLTANGYTGVGSEADPFVISDSESLWELADCSLVGSIAAHFSISNDIDLSQAISAPTSNPIGFSTSALIYSFSGEVDGNDHTISGIAITSSTIGVGLFSLLQGATFRNLGLEGAVTQSGTVANTGALGSRSIGELRIESVRSSVTVAGRGATGGLIGSAQNLIMNDTVVSGRVSGSSGGKDVGGLVGKISGGSSAVITNSRNYGAVSAQDESAGGFFGSVEVSTVIVGSLNHGPVSGTKQVGGFIGRVSQPLSVGSSTNSGAVSATGQDVGGLLGRVQNTIILNSVANEANVVSSNFHVGGLIGRGQNVSMVEYSSNTGAVNGSGYVGGLIGSAQNISTVENSTNSGNITGTVTGQLGPVGGLIGNAQGSATVEHSINSGIVTAQQGPVGGLIGIAPGSATVKNSRNSGDIAGQQGLVGGLIGLAENSATVEHSINLGNISGQGDYVGGLLGATSAGNTTISASQNAGQISTLGTGVGGLVGAVAGDVVIEQSFNSGPVSGSNQVGGLLGFAGNNAQFTNVYNVGVSLGSSFDGLLGGVNGSLSTASAFSTVASNFLATSSVAELKLASTFLGFDFDTTWGFGTPAENDGFPMLRSLRQVTNYFKLGPGLNASTPEQAAVYLGPLFFDRAVGGAGTEVTFNGMRLRFVSSAVVNSVPVQIVSSTARSLTVLIPNSLMAGDHDIYFYSSHGVLKLQQGLRVTAG